MYDIYTKAIAVLEVLERAERSIHDNKPVRVVSRLRREGLFLEKSVAYLVDALRPNEALRFRNAMATIESHFARLNREDKDFIRKEGPATTGFYIAYLEDHNKVLDLARRILLGERKFSEDSQLVELASVLAASPSWIAKVLIPSMDPMIRGVLEFRLQNMLLTAEQELADSPAPAAYIHQLQKLSMDIDRMRVS